MVGYQVFEDIRIAAAVVVAEDMDSPVDKLGKNWKIIFDYQDSKFTC